MRQLIIKDIELQFQMKKRVYIVYSIHNENIYSNEYDFCMNFIKNHNLKVQKINIDTNSIYVA